MRQSLQFLPKQYGVTQFIRRYPTKPSVLFGKNEWSPLGLQAFYISGQNGVIDLLDSKGPMVSLLSEDRADSKSHEIVRVG